MVFRGLFNINRIICFFNALQWLVEKTHQVVWVSSLDYGRLEWQQTLTYLGKTLNVAYEDGLIKHLTMFGVSNVLLLLVTI